MAAFSSWLKKKGIDWPRNLWAGTSITTQGTTSRINSLLKVGDDNTIRFLSVEPQRENIDLTKWLPRLDWLIQGGESGHNAHAFHLEWALEMIAQCKEARVPYFLKQCGSKVFFHGQRVELSNSHGGVWSEWPVQKLRVRQMPKVPHHPRNSERKKCTKTNHK
jgi:protein gp37